MRVVLFATSLQLADNFLPVLDMSRARGAEGFLFLMPWSGYPAHPDFNPNRVPVLANLPLTAMDRTALPENEFQDLIERHLPADMDLVVLAHGHSYPSQVLRQTLMNLGRRTRVAVMQHGMYQDWADRRDDSSFDTYFCFGERDRLQFPKNRRSDVVPVGLPRLDLLRDSRSESGRYILYIGQDVPAPWIIARLMAECRSYFGRPVVIRPHPRFAAAYAKLPNDLAAVPTGIDVDGPVLPVVASADFIITPHSTTLIEALYLQKPVVLIPSHGLTCFSGYPAIAKDFTAAAIAEALARFHERPGQVARFIRESFGGIRYDHSQRCLQAIENLDIKGNQRA